MLSPLLLSQVVEQLLGRTRDSGAREEGQGLSLSLSLREEHMTEVGNASITSGTLLWHLGQAPGSGTLFVQLALAPYYGRLLGSFATSMSG